MDKHADQTHIPFLAYVIAVIIMVLPLPANFVNHILLSAIFITLLLVVLAKSARQSGKDCIFLRTFIFSSLFRLAAHVNIFRIILQGKGHEARTINFFGEAIAGQYHQIGIIISALNGIILLIVILKGLTKLGELEKDIGNTRSDCPVKIQNIRKIMGNELIACIILGLASFVFGYCFAVFMRVEVPQEAFKNYLILTCGFTITMQLSLIMANLAIGLHFFPAPQNK